MIGLKKIMKPFIKEKLLKLRLKPENRELSLKAFHSEARLRIEKFRFSAIHLRSYFLSLDYPQKYYAWFTKDENFKHYISLTISFLKRVEYQNTALSEEDHKKYEKEINIMAKMNYFYNTVSSLFVLILALKYHKVDREGQIDNYDVKSFYSKYFETWQYVIEDDFLPSLDLSDSQIEDLRDNIDLLEYHLNHIPTSINFVFNNSTVNNAKYIVLDSTQEIEKLEKKLKKMKAKT